MGDMELGRGQACQCQTSLRRVGQSMMRRCGALVMVVLSLLTSVATTAYAEEAWESEAAATCLQNAWTFTILGAIGIVVILWLGGANNSHNELCYRNPLWGLSWGASRPRLLGRVGLA